ncbi:bifunctional riboflavin kinase/FAD synthetase [bacterium]|nr:bifunctional riboflavin kinase/FAD synthetase [bacterium]
MKSVRAIAIGGFDGMHIGHQKLFEAVGDSGAILVIETGYANLTPGHEREHYTDLPIFYYELDTIRHLDAEGFIAKLSVEFPALEKIVVGYDFHFGKDRRFTINDLRQHFSGEVEVIAEVSVENDSVHSHKIRAKLQIGDIKGANRFLGYNYTVCGTKVQGQGLGQKELYATINIDVKEFLLPKEGVYVTMARLDDEEHYHPSVSFIGHRVTTDGSFAVETHILDTTVADVRKLRLSFVDFIRPNRKFETLDALKEAIADDIAVAKRKTGQLSL